MVTCSLKGGSRDSEPSEGDSGSSIALHSDEQPGVRAVESGRETCSQSLNGDFLESEVIPMVRVLNVYTNNVLLQAEFVNLYPGAFTCVASNQDPKV